MAHRVLVAEDDDASRELIVYLLRAHGHEVTEACDGAIAVELASTIMPDLIVMDLHMPHLDGFDAVRLLKSSRHTQSIPVLAVTALAMVGDRERVLATGFDGYLSKPVEPLDLLNVIETLLSRRRRRVLVVDNMPANRASIRGALAGLDVAVVDAPDADTAFALAVVDVPDLVLCDLNLTSATGFALLRRMRSDPAVRDVPFVMITSALVDDELIRRAVEEGADDLVERPRRADDLAELVRANLEARTCPRS